MNERVSSEQVQRSITNHQGDSDPDDACDCIECRTRLDLLAARRERDERDARLAECCRLSRIGPCPCTIGFSVLRGADPDGNEDWRLAEYAVEEVGRLRSEYDGVCDELIKKDDQLTAANKALETARCFLAWMWKGIGRWNIGGVQDKMEVLGMIEVYIVERGSEDEDEWREGAELYRLRPEWKPARAAEKEGCR